MAFKARSLDTIKMRRLRRSGNNSKGDLNKNAWNKTCLDSKNIKNIKHIDLKSYCIASSKE